MIRALPLCAAALSGLLMFAQSEPWQPADEMPAQKLADRLTASGAKPLVLYVGFPVLYRSTRIPGAVLAGPVGKPEGLETLKQAVAKVQKNAEIVIYCGCCPFTQCPNIRPAFRVLREMGFTNVKVIVMPVNLATDWVAKGYPTEKSAGKS